MTSHGSGVDVSLSSQGRLKSESREGQSTAWALTTAAKATKDARAKKVERNCMVGERMVTAANWGARRIDFRPFNRILLADSSKEWAPLFLGLGTRFRARYPFSFGTRQSRSMFLQDVSNQNLSGTYSSLRKSLPVQIWIAAAFSGVAALRTA